MKPLALEEIRQAMHGHWLLAGEPAVVKGVSTDTRTAKPGDLFIAIRGQRVDGHEFLPAAASAGCVSAVIALDGGPRPEVARLFPAGLIGVRDTVRALGLLGSYHRRLLPATVVAVTGSNGKTTVKRMVHHILLRRLTGSCSPKSYNNQIGVPLTLLSAGPGDDYVVCELGTNAPGEIAGLTHLVQPNVAVITCVAETHLEKLVSLERVAAEKASILEGLPADGLAVAWADSELLSRLVGAYGRRVVRFGQADQADLRLTGYQARGRLQRFQLNGRLWVDLPLAGRHNALNAMAAIGVAQRFGFSQADAAAALADFEGAEMRMQWLDCGRLTIINDAYNSNPSSLLAAAEVLAETEAGRRVLIAGDMRELGPQARQLHLQTGRQIGQMRVDLLIGVGQLGRYIAKGAAEKPLRVEAIGSVKALGQAVGKLLTEGDVVLIKASRAVGLESLIEPIRSAFARKQVPRSAGRAKRSARPVGSKKRQ